MNYLIHLNDIIFLDIDGVLATPKKIHEYVKFHGTSCPPGIPQIDRSCVRVLKDLVSRRDAMVVISSSWRKSAEDMYALFQIFNDYDIPIVGMTPGHSDGIRGGEIEEYMQTHCVLRENILIVDDETTGLDMFTDRLLKPDGLIGLTEEDYRRAISDLGW